MGLRNWLWRCLRDGRAACTHNSYLHPSLHKSFRKVGKELIADPPCLAEQDPEQGNVSQQMCILGLTRTLRLNRRRHVQTKLSDSFRSGVHYIFEDPGSFSSCRRPLLHDFNLLGNRPLMYSVHRKVKDEAKGPALSLSLWGGGGGRNCR